MNSREAFEQRFGPACDEAYSQRWEDRLEAWNAALSAAKQGVDIDREQWQLVPVVLSQSLDDKFSKLIRDNFFTRVIWSRLLAAAKEQQT